MSSNKKIRRLGIAAAVALAGAAVALPSGAANASEAEPSYKVVEKEWRTLAPWTSEAVPEYRCPGSHPYLEDRNFAPFATSLIDGVEIQQHSNPWPIGVSITKGVGVKDPKGGLLYLIGTSSHPLASSTTNWGVDVEQLPGRAALHGLDQERRHADHDRLTVATKGPEPGNRFRPHCAKPGVQVSTTPKPLARRPALDMEQVEESDLDRSRTHAGRPPHPAVVGNHVAAQGWPAPNGRTLCLGGAG